MRLVGYVRVSDESQVEGYSLDAQRSAIKAECERQGYDLLTILGDEGRSAKSDALHKRPSFQHALQMVESKEADGIIVHKWDRAARNLMVLLEVARRTNGNIISVIESGIDTRTPHGRLVMQMLGSVAEFFSNNLGTETRKGKRERVRSGLWLGSLPYGYQKQDGDTQGKLPPILDDRPLFSTLCDRRTWTRVDAVRHVFSLAAQGLTRREICSEMQRLGFEEIGRGLLASILRNRFYLGEVRHRSGDGGEWLPGVHPPLVDRVTFDKAQHAAASNRKGSAVLRRSARSGALTGLCQCGRCGGPMHIMRDKGVPRLLCASRCADGSCDQVSVKAEVIEQRLADLLRVYSPPEDITEQLAQLVSEPDTEVEVRAIETQQRRLTDLYEWGRITDTEFQAKMRDLDSRLATIPRDHEDVQELSAMLHDLASTYHQEEDEAVRNQLARKVFTRLLVDGQELVSVKVRPGIDRVLSARARTLELAAQRSWRCRGARRRRRW